MKELSCQFICRKAAHKASEYCETRHQSWGSAGQRQRNGLEGKCDFPQVMKSNCCHFLGSNFGSGEPGGEIGCGVKKEEKKEPFLERRPLSTLSNRFALATITRITLEQRDLDHHCHRRQHLLQHLYICRHFAVVPQKQHEYKCHPCEWQFSRRRNLGHHIKMGM